MAIAQAQSLLFCRFTCRRQRPHSQRCIKCSSAIVPFVTAHKQSKPGRLIEMLSYEKLWNDFHEPSFFTRFFVSLLLQALRRRGDRPCIPSTHLHPSHKHFWRCPLFVIGQTRSSPTP